MKSESKPFYGGCRQNLPAGFFTSESIYEEEWEKVFSRRWLCAGRASELQGRGDFRQCNLEGESILLVRDGEEKLHGFYNHCRHRGAKLCEDQSGHFGENIQCPYHAWTYSFNGRLSGAPNMAEVEGFRKSDYPLERIAMEVWEGFIFLNFGDKPEPFERTFAPVKDKFAQWRLPELQVAHRKSYPVGANWKLLFHNFSECYHCPTVHPRLNDITPYKNSSNDLKERPILGGPMLIKPKGGSLTMSGRACGPLLAGRENRQKVYFYTFFPNLFLSLHPEYVVSHRLERQATGETLVHCDWLFHPEAMESPDFRLEEAVQFWDMTNRQDWHVCELTQKGLLSRKALPGPYAKLESMLAAFDREYLGVMGKRDQSRDQEQ